MGAMPEEIETLIPELGDVSVSAVKGMRTYHCGSLWGQPVVAVFSRCGKVAAAATAVHLITDFGVDRIVFTGVAGAADRSLRVGDVVVAKCLYQHDMDARPLFQRHEIPLLNTAKFETSPKSRTQAVHAAKAFLAHDLSQTIAEATLSTFGITEPKVVEADVASGDKFFARQHDLDELLTRLPVSCVEMEGAAVAQVCFEYGIDYTIIRTISDSADDSAHVDFLQFMNLIGSAYSHGIVKRLLTAGYTA